jgi:phosphomannomutase
MLGNFEVMSFCSNTEPIVRVVVESADAQWVAHVVNRIHAL